MAPGGSNRGGNQPFFYSAARCVGGSQLGKWRGDAFYGAKNGVFEWRFANSNLKSARILALLMVAGRRPATKIS